MELTIQQLQRIGIYLYHQGVRYPDIHLETVDHVASLIEDKLKTSNEGFDTVLVKAYEEFNDERFKNLLLKREILNGKYWSFSFFKKVASLYTFGKMFLMLFLATLVLLIDYEFQFSKESTEVLLLNLCVAPMVVFMIINLTCRISNNSLGFYKYFGGFPLIFCSLYSSFFLIISMYAEIYTFSNNLFSLIISLNISFFIVSSYILLYELPYKHLQARY